MKILITGGTGFIGSRLALKCLENGDSVRVLGQANNSTEIENKKAIERKGAEVVLASVVDWDRVLEAVQGVECVYHLAAAQHEANVPDQVFWDVNVSGTKNLVEASVEATVKRFVHGSTIGVYGASLEGRIDEGSPLRPSNIYEETKLEAEKIVLEFREKIPVTILRISETYGPGDRRLLKLFKGIKKNFFFMIGNGNNMHHLIYIDDLLEALFLAATSEHAAGRTFVLSGKEAISSNDMVAQIAKQLETSIPRFRAPVSLFIALATIIETILRPLRIQPPLHRRRIDFFTKSFVFSQEESSRTLGFVPKVGFNQGVSKTIKWYEEMGYL